MYIYSYNIVGRATCTNNFRRSRLSVCMRVRAYVFRGPKVGLFESFLRFDCLLVRLCFCNCVPNVLSLIWVAHVSLPRFS